MGVWFPNGIRLSANGILENAQQNTITSVSAGGTIGAFSMFNRNIDAPWVAASHPVALGSAGTLKSQAESGAYILKRIVGSIFVRHLGTSVGQEVQAFAGIVKDDTLLDGSVDVTDWNPFGEDGQRKRWLWRRAWMLNSSGIVNGPASPITWPSNNVQYGSMKEGSHIDCKMKASVKWEERLFWIFGVIPSDGIVTNPTVQFTPHIRIFGKFYQGAAAK